MGKTTLRKSSKSSKVVKSSHLQIERNVNSTITAQAPLQPKNNLSALQNKFAKKLEGSRFRMINEKLYTSKGETALQYFQSDPSLFDVYHTGFREQASKWPNNPLDDIIKWIKTSHPEKCIADMGCGEARLARSVSNKVHSFDLVSRNEFITAADIAHVPLEDCSVDIVIFCLALMGTNIGDFILEAHRILKPNGILKIVEVRSRFEKESDGVKKFIRVVKRAGFALSMEKSLNEMFFTLECTKSPTKIVARSSEQLQNYSAKPCIYKRR